MEAQLTLTDQILPSCNLLFQVTKSIQGCDYLDGADRVEHVRIMTRSGAKASFAMKAGENKVEQSSPGQGVRLAEVMECCQSPVDAAQSQMFGEPVVEFVLALPCCQRQLKLGGG